MSKYRLIVNDISFYSTDDQISDGVGDLTNLNQAIRQARSRLFMTDSLSVHGLFNDYRIQIDLIVD